MISDDERCEVAERLRVYSHDFDFGDSNPFWYVAKAAFGDVDAHTYHSVFARLAGLIDRPTCNNTLPQNWGTFECSECGAQFEVNSVFITAGGTDASEPVIPRYCPNCGARVVTDDD